MDNSEDLRREDAAREEEEVEEGATRGGHDEESEEEEGTMFSVSEALDALNMTINPQLASEDDRSVTRQVLLLRLTLCGEFEAFSGRTTSRIIDQFVRRGGIPIIQSFLKIDREIQNNSDRVIREALLLVLDVVEKGDSEATAAALMESSLFEDLLALFVGHRTLALVVYSACVISGLFARGSLTTATRDALFVENGFAERLCQLIVHPSIPSCSRSQLSWAARALCVSQSRPTDRLLDPFYEIFFQMFKAFFNSMDQRGPIAIAFPYIPVSSGTLLEGVNVVVDEWSLTLEEEVDVEEDDTSEQFYSNLLTSLATLTQSEEGTRRFLNGNMFAHILKIFSHKDQAVERLRKERIREDTEKEEAVVCPAATSDFSVCVASEQLGEVLSFLPRRDLVSLGTLNKSFFLRTVCGAPEAVRELLCSSFGEEAAGRHRQQFVLSGFKMIMNVMLFGDVEARISALHQGVLDLLGVIASFRHKQDALGGDAFLFGLLLCLTIISKVEGGVVGIIDNKTFLEGIAEMLVHPHIGSRDLALHLVRHIAADHFAFLLRNEWAFKNLLMPTIAIKLTHFNDAAVEDVLSFLDDDDDDDAADVVGCSSKSSLKNKNNFVPSRSFISCAGLTQFRHVVESAKVLFSSKHENAPSLSLTPASVSEGGRTDADDYDDVVNYFVFESESSSETHKAFLQFVAEMCSYANVLGTSIPKTRVRGKKDTSREGECSSPGEGFGSKECVTYYLVHELRDAFRCPSKNKT